MAKPKENRRPRGRPESYPGEGRAVRRSFSAPVSVANQLAAAAEQIGVSESAIVLAGLRAILSQTPDCLAAQIGPRTPAAE